jgi:CRP/FNR family transcriptional regulator, cyclic AMP receptor protein
MEQQTVHTVQAGDIFQDLSDAERAQVERQISYASYPAGQLFYSPDEQGEALFVLRQGRVRLYKLSPEGRALTLALLEPIALFGEMTLVGQWLHDSFAESMTECVIGTLDREELRQILLQHPQVALRFMELMGTRLRTIENKLADLAFKSVPQRLASVLLGFADANANGNGKGDNKTPQITRYTHQQLAEMIGSYRETVTKAMGEFRDHGIIRIDNDQIYLLDLDELHALAGR